MLKGLQITLPEHRRWVKIATVAEKTETSGKVEEYLIEWLVRYLSNFLGKSQLHVKKWVRVSRGRVGLQGEASFSDEHHVSQTSDDHTDGMTRDICF